ncbi:Unconventional Myosin-Xvi [Manis pentadactyla]|nr:Unconventional Myosin-Xvi [Manis pentadactyla]
MIEPTFPSPWSAAAWRREKFGAEGSEIPETAPLWAWIQETHLQDLKFKALQEGNTAMLLPSAAHPPHAVTPQCP